MSVAPIRHSVELRADPPLAFGLFVQKIALWWPKSKSIGQAPPASVHIEPGVGGRWFERDEQGRETDWGRVLAWEPPGRLLLAWQVGADFRFDPELITEVELTFQPRPGGGTRATLEHRRLERMGVDAPRVRGQLDGGWPGVLDLFAQLADANS